MLRNNLGDVLQAQGKYAEAQEHHHIALNAWRKTVGDDHPNIALAHSSLGELLVAQNRPAEALAHYERAWAIYDRPEIPAHKASAAAFALAKVLWQLARDRRRARELAERAGDLLSRSEESDSERLRDIERWLSERAR
jgi:serine/threonine-protein kinase